MNIAIFIDPEVLIRPLVMVYPLPIKINSNRNINVLAASKQRAERKRRDNYTRINSFTSSKYLMCARYKIFKICNF